MVDYNDLKIIVRGEISSGNSYVALDLDDTITKTFEQENISFGMKAFSI